MTIQNAIDRCDETKPNQYTTKQKVAWLSQLDGLVYEEMILTHEKNEGETVPSSFSAYTEEKMDVTLLVPDPYSEMYIDYLFMKIDYNNAELERYNNSAIMFNNSYRTFTDFFNRTHRPLQAYRVTV